MYVEKTKFAAGIVVALLSVYTCWEIRWSDKTIEGKYCGCMITNFLWTDYQKPVSFNRSTKTLDILHDWFCIPANNFCSLGARSMDVESLRLLNNLCCCAIGRWLANSFDLNTNNVLVSMLMYDWYEVMIISRRCNVNWQLTSGDLTPSAFFIGLTWCKDMHE